MTRAERSAADGATSAERPHAAALAARHERDRSPRSRRARRRTRPIARGLVALGTLIALVPLVLIIYYLLKKGLGAWSWTSSPPTRRQLPRRPGRDQRAILGTIEIVALAALIAIPIGIGVALYLVEYGKESRFAQTVRYFVDVMTGVPSIVFGLFVYITLVVAGSAALRRLEGRGRARRC